MATSTSTQSSSQNAPEYQGPEGVWWHGSANFGGQIIAPACTLGMEDVWQVIEMGTTRMKDMQASIPGPEKIFYLGLENCELTSEDDVKPDAVLPDSQVRVTFDGLRGHSPDRFGVLGQARGVELQILDSQGNRAFAGKAMPPQLLKGSEQRLQYALRLIRNGEPLRGGDYYAVVRLKVDYE
ncbi:type 1 fimbrial protein [Buttiauxella sp. 3AFRM03]|nr:type 1 fimbrial protein [Buttiauxella sp. 3AFRM03]